ncbi:MAG: glycogen-binding domain-containing protein [Treponema sp.]|nr:glycogen-binding domain-containing protein [Treponema sp.]
MRRFLLKAIFLLCTAAVFAAAKKELPSDEELDYSQLVSEIPGYGSPYMKDDYVIFTSPDVYRHVGIAFEFENFRTIHSFRIKKLYDMDFNEKGAIMFYILKLPKDVQKVNYRMVFDGLWTLDPYNNRKIFDSSTGLYLSQFDAARNIPDITETKKDGRVRFVYKGESGQHIRLGGSFTNWDSWIYEMTEVEPGLYEFYLTLNPGTYQYAFYSGINSYIDKGNPERCYTKDGKEASILTVK